jgi:rhodanese-related sulfurtransferase
MIFSNFFSRRAGADPGEIGHDELAEALKSKSCMLVDVREPHEFSAGHVPGSVNHPLSRFDPHRLPAGGQVVLICGAGKRSASALGQARAAGLTAVRHYPGGVMGWRREGGDLG